MTFAGLLALIIIGALVLDHLWIAAAVLIAGAVFAVCYRIGKDHDA